MGNVTGMGLHHLQGEDEALLSEEGACFNSGSSWSTPQILPLVERGTGMD